MKQDMYKSYFIRKLNSTEKAMAMTNMHFPLCVTIVLRLYKGPAPLQLRKALDILQDRHPMLKAGISHRGGWYFYAMPEPKAIPLKVVERLSDEDWQKEAEIDLNRRIDMEGPLMKAVYMWPGSQQGRAELLLTFHHSFVDSISLRLILHELLSFCGGAALEDVSPGGDARRDASTVMPGFSSSFRGLRGFVRLLPFMGRQLAEEWHFFRYGKSRAIPSDSHNAVICLQLSVSESKNLMEYIGQKGLSLNSTLNAAIVIAYTQRCFDQSSGAVFRTLAFADLRPYLLPSPPADHFGCFVSLLRFSVTVDTDETLLSLSGKLNQRMFQARRKGDLQLFSMISSHLTSLSMAIQRARMANTALSYMGPLDLQPVYGEMELLDVHAFITNNKLGAEFSGFAKILFNRIEMDFTYLTAEMDHGTATILVQDIKRILKKIY